MIGFFSSNLDISVGSYRIWINDLASYFLQIGIEAKVFNTLDVLDQCDTIIFSKADASLADKIKKILPQKKIGVINLSCDNVSNNSDFVIVGSIEEKISMSWHNNVFIFPLIEKVFQDHQIKTHTQDNNKIKLCYHGNTAHLSRFQHGLKQAIEEVNKEVEVELDIITGNKNFNWTIGKPKIQNINFKKWHIDSIKDNILLADVGLVPNMSDVVELGDYSKRVDNSQGLYNTDFAMRMKNKSNAGRSFVFHQLGIPVISDMTPSNLHILGDPDCGYVAFNKNSWKKAIFKLGDANRRNFIAKNAKKEFDRLYNPHKWAKRLHKNINNLEI